MALTFLRLSIFLIAGTVTSFQPAALALALTDTSSNSQKQMLNIRDSVSRSAHEATSGQNRGQRLLRKSVENQPIEQLEDWRNTEINIVNAGESNGVDPESESEPRVTGLNVQGNNKSDNSLSSDSNNVNQIHNHTIFSIYNPDSSLSNLLTKFNITESTETHKQHFIDFVNNQPTRYIGTEGNAKAAEYIKQEFLKLGLEKVGEQEFTVGGTSNGPSGSGSSDSVSPGALDTILNMVGGGGSGSGGTSVGGIKCKNIYGFLEGKSKDKIVIGAHYDDLPSSGSGPGADDNASGVAAMLAIAREMTKFVKITKKKPEKTIEFVGFSAEEEGLYGSAEFVKQDSSGKISDAIILDEVGFTKNPEKPGLIFETVGDEHASQQHLINLLGEANRGFFSVSKSTSNASESGSSPVAGMNLNVNYHGFASDHISFLNAGNPAVLVIERDNLEAADNFGHTSDDKLQHINFEFAKQIVETTFRAVIGLAFDEKEIESENLGIVKESTDS